MIDEEIDHARNGEEAYFAAKVNSVSDKQIMDKLAEASQSGVKVELVVRGICCLKPGVPGYTENIRIVSIVGRFLEHSRIYISGTEDRRKVYISSADFMTRNTVHRVEVAVPLLDNTLREQAVSLVKLCLADNVKARIGQPDGSFQHCIPVLDDSAVNAQEIQYQNASANAVQS